VVWFSKKLNEVFDFKGLLTNLLASIIYGSVVFWAGTYFVPSWYLLFAMIALPPLAIMAFGVIRWWRARVFQFVPYLGREALLERLRSARAEIWSFQISGGDLTTSADGAYEEWLREDRGRRLKVLFANPDNEGLLQSIVKLSGFVADDEKIDLSLLRGTIKRSIDKYLKLRGQFPSQVEVRTYDCSPPCSVHAVDAASSSRGGSMFVECYLPQLRWADRPCFLLRRSHSQFSLYSGQCKVWFDQATPVP